MNILLCSFDFVNLLNRLLLLFTLHTLHTILIIIWKQVHSSYIFELILFEY